MRKSKQLLAFFKSLKFRLILFILVLAIVPSLILAAGLLNSYESRAVSIRESEILSQAKILANQIATSDYMNMDEEVESSTIQAQIDMLTTIYDGRVIIVDRNFRVYCDTYNLDDHKMIIAEEVIRSFRGEDITHYDSENHYIEMTIPISNPNDSSDKVLGVMLISVSTDNIQINQGYLRQIATIIVVIVAVAMVFFGVLMVLHFLKPFAKISEGISAIKEGYGDDCLQVNNYTETAQICDRFNQMLSRMKVMDDSRQEFVSNVSHELKTPIALIQGYAEGLKEGITDDPESMEFYCDVIMDEANKMNTMVKRLLTLNQIEFGNDEPEMERFDINELIASVADANAIRAGQKNMSIVFDNRNEHNFVWADEYKTEEVLTNYISNALNHCDGKRAIEVRTEKSENGGTITVTVYNSGKNIADEDLERIWEKFYKTDKARTREYGGNGIGLSIVKAIMDSMGQEYGVRNVSDGVEFWFNLDCKS